MANIDTSPSQVTTSALSALPFDTLIGGPLDACIKAQALAAKTSWEFIKNVGLTTDKDTGETKAINVTFQYQKGGEMTNLVVPLLTIVPIPYIAIDTITIDFLANMSASASSVSEQSSSENIGGEASGSAKVGWGPFSAEVSIKANYSSKKDSKASQDSKYSVEYTMGVHVAASQSNMPAGLAAVLNILQGSITDASPNGAMTVSPTSGILNGDKSGGYFEFAVKNNHGILQSDVELTIAQPANLPAVVTLTPTVLRGTSTTTGFPVTAKTDAAGVVGLQIAMAVTGATAAANVPTKLTAVGSIQNPPVNPGDTPPPPTPVSASAGLTVIVPAPPTLLPAAPPPPLIVAAPHSLALTSGATTSQLTIATSGLQAVTVTARHPRPGDRIIATVTDGRELVELHGDKQGSPAAFFLKGKAPGTARVQFRLESDDSVQAVLEVTCR